MLMHPRSQFALILLASLSAIAGAFTPQPTSTPWLDAGQNIFRQGELLHITITFDSDPAADPNQLINCESNQAQSATVRIQNAAIDEIYTSCGVRNRGTYTRCHRNRSWDISFDEFIDRKIHGIDSLDLKADAFDPSSARSWTAWYLMGKAGIPASRCVATSLTINGRYYGLQHAIENLDKNFLKAWFGENNGTRFKCGDSIADLTWRGPHRDAYDGSDNQGGQDQGYELKSKNLDVDYSRLIDFINFINNSPDNDFRAAIESRFNVDNFLRWMAVNMVIGSWDDYWIGSNNYGLYLPSGSTRWEWLPYDYDLSLGMNLKNINWSRRPFDKRWAKGVRLGTGKAPLAERIMAIPEYQARLYQYVHDLSNSVFSDASLFPVLDSHFNIIREAGLLDTQDDFTSEQFLMALDAPAQFKKKKIPVLLGIKPFISARNQYIREKVSPLVPIK